MTITPMGDVLARHCCSDNFRENQSMKGLRSVVVGSIVGSLLSSASFFAVDGLMAVNVSAQLAEEGTNDLGNKYKIFIYSKESMGGGRWRFQTKTVGEGLAKPYYSDWQTADCWKSTIDGKLVGAVKIRPNGRGGGSSDAGILQAVCP